MATLERAIALAAEYHAGQTDKGGQPYILHPLRVMAAVSGIEHKMAAVLHDIVEDTPVTFEMLRQEGFSEAVVEALRALTKRKGETRIQAAHRAAANPIAKTVKLADLADNMDLSRLNAPTARDMRRMAEYGQVKAFLEQA